MKKTSTSTQKSKGGAQAHSLSPAQGVAPLKPIKHAGTTKIESENEQKTRQWIAIHWSVFKVFCRVFYHDLLLVRKGVVWIVLTRHDELLQIVMLLIVLILEYRIHSAHLFHH